MNSLITKAQHSVDKGILELMRKMWKATKRLSVCRGLALVLGLGLIIGMDRATAAEALKTCKPIGADHFQEKRHALVLGNSHYRFNDSLPKVTADVQDMAHSLCDLGFEVIYALDLDLAGMRGALDSFAQMETPGDVRLFYFSGHGVQSADATNYLIPIEAKIVAQKDISDSTAISFDDVFKALGRKVSATDNALRIVILDACRNNSFAGLSPKPQIDIVSGLALPMRAPEGTFISFATAPGLRASEKGSSHSVFSEALLGRIKTPGLRLPALFDLVRSDVLERTDHVQIPWENVSTTSDFFFAPPIKMELRIDDIDDLGIVTINGYPLLEDTSPTSWKLVPEGILRTGENVIEAFVYNDRTRQGLSPFGPKEGWRSSFSLRINGQEPVTTFRSCEDPPQDEHWGRVFSVVKARLEVNSATGGFALKPVMVFPCKQR